MEPTLTVAVLEALACGADPQTGEELGPGAVCRKEEVRAALEAAVDCLNRVGRKGLKPLPGNAGKPWDAEETLALCKAFEKGRTVPQLMAAHRRTRGAITARLRMSGLLPWPEPK